MVLLGRVVDRLKVVAGLRIAQRAPLVALGLLGLWGGGAWAGETVGVVIDPASGLVQMIVVPDSDAELNDPAFNPPGRVQVRLAKSQFDGATPEQFVARASEAAKRSLKAQIEPLAAPRGPQLSPAEAAEFDREKREQARAQ